MKLTNMKMSAQEAKEYAQPTVAANAPEYPWGLSIELNRDALAKLGIEKLPELGASMELMAKVEVCGASGYKEQDGDKNLSLRLQITDMAIEAAAPESSAADKLYGKGKE